MQLILPIVLTCLMMTVIVTDLTRYIIPNWLNALLLLLYPVMVFLSPARPDWGVALLIGLGMLLVGLFVLMRFIGGGDVKLLIVTSVWAGKTAFAQFIMGVALLGGVLALFLLVARPLASYLFLKIGKGKTPVPRVLGDGEPIPYGLAIAWSFLFLLWSRGLPGVVF